MDGRLPDSLTWTRVTEGTARPTSAEIMVSRALAQRFWPTSRAVGARLREGRPCGYTCPCHTG